LAVSHRRRLIDYHENTYRYAACIGSEELPSSLSAQMLNAHVI